MGVAKGVVLAFNARDSRTVPARAMSEYKLKFEIFEGPLDLLLHLVKKEEVDIHQVNLTKITTQFIEYIDLMRVFDLDIAGEFLVMASTLMYIKSRELLPVEQQVVAEGEEEEEDPRWELIRRLVEYKKFKDAAAQLQERESAQEHIYPRLPGKPEFAADGPVPRAPVSVFDLVNAVNSILKRFTTQEARDVYEDKWTVGEKIESILTLIQTRPVLKFSELFVTATTRGEVIVTFLAMLELIRLRQMVIDQPEPFAEIEIRIAPPETLAESAPDASMPIATENAENISPAATN